MEFKFNQKSYPFGKDGDIVNRFLAENPTHVEFKTPTYTIDNNV